MNRKNIGRGFSLVELLVVIAIIAILAGLILSALAGARKKAQQTVCLNNLLQVCQAMRMYCDDSDGTLPGAQGASTGSIWNSCWNNHRLLLDAYVRVSGNPSPRDTLFACPADTFYVDLKPDLVQKLKSPVMANQGLHAQTNLVYSSYGFNEGMTNLFYLFKNTIGIGGRRLDSIKTPGRTVLMAEAPAFLPYSWHQPGLTSIGAVKFRDGGVLFSDARNMVGFVDGHVNYTKIYWNPSPIQPGVRSIAYQYNPPVEYEYQWGDE